jgi:hypothetical protein
MVSSPRTARERSRPRHGVRRTRFIRRGVRNAITRDDFVPIRFVQTCLYLRLRLAARDQSRTRASSSASSAGIPASIIPRYSWRLSGSHVPLSCAEPDPKLEIAVTALEPAAGDRCTPRVKLELGAPTESPMSLTAQLGTTKKRATAGSPDRTVRGTTKRHRAQTKARSGDL